MAPDESSANSLVEALNAAGYTGTAAIPPSEDASHWAVTAVFPNHPNGSDAVQHTHNVEALDGSSANSLTLQPTLEEGYMNLLKSYFIAPDESAANTLVAALNAAGYTETAVMPPREDAPHWAVTVVLTNDADRSRAARIARRFDTWYVGWAASAPGQVWYRCIDDEELAAFVTALALHGYAVAIWGPDSTDMCALDAWPLSQRGVSQLSRLVNADGEYGLDIPGRGESRRFFVTIPAYAQPMLEAAGVNGEYEVDTCGFVIVGEFGVIQNVDSGGLTVEPAEFIEHVVAVLKDRPGEWVQIDRPHREDVPAQRARVPESRDAFWAPLRE